MYEVSCELPEVVSSTPTVIVDVVRMGCVQDTGVEASLILSFTHTLIIYVAGVKMGCVQDTGAEASLILSNIYHARLESILGFAGLIGNFLQIKGVGGSIFQWRDSFQLLCTTPLVIIKK